MAQILIRNIDEDTVAALKELAKAHGRSLQAEALKILERGVVGKTKNPAKIAADIRKKLAHLNHPAEPLSCPRLSNSREDGGCVSTL